MNMLSEIRRVLIFLIVVLLHGVKLVRVHSEGGQRILRLENQCEYTVWPGLLSNAGLPLLADGGFTLLPGASRDVEAPAGWSGRIWGRTGCPTAATSSSSSPSSSSSSISMSCLTGDCGGGRIQCGGAGATPPATLAEFTLASRSGGSVRDFYDVSLVDGFNLAISIVPINASQMQKEEEAAAAVAIGSGGAREDLYTCGVAGCSANLNLVCPAALQVRAAAAAAAGGAQVVGCKSACDAFRADAFCCAGAYADPNTCKPSSYSRAFKNACPAAYSYAFDDPTSTFTCIPYSASSSVVVNYAVVFCPSSLSEKTATIGNNAAPNKSFTSSLNCVCLLPLLTLFFTFFVGL